MKAQTKIGQQIDDIIKVVKEDWIRKENALEYVLENHYDEVREAIFEQEAESR